MSEMEIWAPANLPDDPIAAVQPLPGPQADALDFMRSAIATLGDLVEANPDDIEGLARAHLLAARVKKELDMLQELIRPYLIGCMGKNKQVDLDGIGRLQKRTGVSYTTWDHDQVRSAVRREAMARTVEIDTETGEISPDAKSVEIAVDEVLNLIWSVFGKSTPNAGGVRSELGLEPDEFAKVKFGDQSITITGGNK